MFVRAPKELALLVINRRKKLKLSQSEVASLVGLKQKTISAFENKPGGTKLDTLFRILSAVKLDVAVSMKDDAATMKFQWKKEW